MSTFLHNLKLSELEIELNKYKSLINSFDYLKLTIASPKLIQNWCNKVLPNGEVIGEVLNGETLNIKTKLPVPDGLFCQKIFGPIKDWKCACGKYKGILINKICEICKTQLTESRVRRYNMGYISLPTPIAHFWYFNGSPAYLYYFLSLAEPSKQNIDFKELIYFYANCKDFSQNRFIFETINKIDDFTLTFEMTGSELILKYLEYISHNLEDKINYLRNSHNSLNTSFQQLRILESFLASKTKPEWMILTNLPVLPPILRPLVEIDNSTFVSSDLNELYRIILYRIHRYKFLQKKYNLTSKGWFSDAAVSSLAYHDKRLIQQGIDALIDNARTSPDVMNIINDRTLKGLTETLENKYGRFRATLLGKRVDYSGRSVIVVEPDLALNEFGLPFKMGLEIFKPFLIKLLLKTDLKKFIEKPKFLVEILAENKLFLWKLLEKLSFNYSFLLNRAPTLHKYGIQAFLPILLPTRAIQLHPLVCSGFNADFDGDQMAIHLPLYKATQLEAKSIMRPSFNLFTPANGEVLIKPSQDMVIGCYYLSLFLNHQTNHKNLWFINETNVLTALYQKKIELHTPVFCRYKLTSLKIALNNNKLYIFFSNIFSEEIEILKIYQNLNKNYFFITNLGVIVGKCLNSNNFELCSIFFKTTPGRILFSNIFKNF